MIHATNFHDLLDYLAGQFFLNKRAVCVGDEFGIQISSNAKEYFTIGIIPENLEKDLIVLGVLIDDSAHKPSRNGFTFVIYIDTDKIKENIGEGALDIIAASIIIHEINHFAYYYELFLKKGDDTGIKAHSNFTHEVSVTMMGAITEEQDNTSQTIFDEHNFEDLIRNLEKFPKKHFSKGKETKIDYINLTSNLIDHFKLKEMIADYIKKIRN